MFEKMRYLRHFLYFMLLHAQTIYSYFKAESEFRRFARARYHLQGSGALCQQDPHEPKQEQAKPSFQI